MTYYLPIAGASPNPTPSGGLDERDSSSSGSSAAGGVAGGVVAAVLVLAVLAVAITVVVLLIMKRQELAKKNPFTGETAL